MFATYRLSLTYTGSTYNFLIGMRKSNKHSVETVLGVVKVDLVCEASN